MGIFICCFLCHKLLHTSAIIVNEQLIVYPEICDVRKMIMNVFQCMGAKPIIAVETSYAEPMIAMVGAGLGITLLPETALQ
ncbi:hypothetical protein BW900_10365 [Bacillus mycoides]|uniref:LysR substrate-binding domain-containing protein n=1 Tax=Bacillus mycoides TaxID=1405 RepID=A0A1S9TAV6_BACMY|nr:hypothetical protein BW900_10365 [Bacillus mycoides]RAN70456.1 hypothetical protein B5P40_14410 [Bacillus sp. SRB_8]